jgi:hypothetical protein
MCESVENGLFIELVGTGVGNDWSVQIVVQVGWSSDGVEGNVPVDPSDDPMVQNLPQKY